MKLSSLSSLTTRASSLGFFEQSLREFESVWHDALLEISWVALARSARRRKLRLQVQCSQPVLPLYYCVDDLKCWDKAEFENRYHDELVVAGSKAWRVSDSDSFQSLSVASLSQWPLTRSCKVKPPRHRQQSTFLPEMWSTDERHHRLPKRVVCSTDSHPHSVSSLPRTQTMADNILPMPRLSQ